MKVGNMKYGLLVAMVSITLSMDVNNQNGEIIRGLPCIKRLNQLFCPSAGSTYPEAAIGKYIVDNKALMRRMFGELQQQKTVTRTTVRVVRTFNGGGFAFSHGDDIQFSRFRRDILEGTADELMEGTADELEFNSFEEASAASNATHTGTERKKRQADFPGVPKKNKNKVDVCESTVEIVTPYWASNSNGKVRAVLNNKEFEQAIHQEICVTSETPRCSRDCSCEQKYKWHRLLAYDPNNDCAGIFMDWFLFPSCCVCRCNKNPFLTN